jgi:hypothetical protein
MNTDFMYRNGLEVKEFNKWWHILLLLSIILNI